MLDEENMMNFVKIFDSIKTYFQCILLISHLDWLKETADNIIQIEDKQSFAFLDI
jgi:DNA repair exonuclease SbcCD ATPase subunit